MTQNRYFYWLFIMNSLINIINFVPRELMDTRFKGAQTSILAAVVLGTAFVYLFTALMAKFPGKGIQEILDTAFSRVFIIPLMVIFAALWCAAGLITILSFIDITLRFISPDTGPYLVVLGFLVVVFFCARMDSLSLLYGLEVMLGISVPLILYTLFKAVTNPDFSWDAVLQIITYFPHAPDVKSMAAATFSFSGYINMAVFNRVLPKLRLKHRWILGVQGLAVLLLTFYVPIGYFGTVAVERHVYTWFSTADSIGINTFIIERMLFIFYFAYLNLSLTSVIIHWHVGKELLTGLFPSPKNPKSKAKVWRELAILGLFSAVTLILMRLDQYQLNALGIWFLLARWLGELLLIMLLFYCYTVLRRRNP
ncbi:hypothetical protein PAECIP111892_03361 [Paenibacillus auburnensis]|uniref:Spore germination protein n=1 Tax=Paenibacillus auburnensis TaxID=2905649 RepID=A0ABM9CE84_9BACL|nr:GerAB/ArcD/ProY family transporter [Paenibacillus auburnensis]CAH1209965.1 hypothetical protein PAECIP111892_03361 [Paenibacillus auburnensis]